MDPNENPEHAALIVQSGVALNSLDSAVRKLGKFQTADKKLQGGWSELRKLAANVHARLLARLCANTGDYMNEVSNQSEQITLCLCYLPADQRRKLVSLAEDMARPFQVIEQPNSLPAAA